MAEESDQPQLSVNERRKIFESKLAENRPPVPQHRPRDQVENDRLFRPKPPISPKPTNLKRNDRILPLIVTISEGKEAIEIARNTSSTSNFLFPCHAEQSSSNGALYKTRTITHSSRSSSQVSIENDSTEILPHEVSLDPVARSESDSESDGFVAANTMRRDRRGRADRTNSSSFPERRSFFYTDSMVSIASLHEKIMDELVQNNIIRASRRKMISSKEQHVTRRPPSLLSESSTINSDNIPQTQRSSSTSAESVPVENDPIPYYDTGDAAEDARLRKLHFAAYEFLTVEEKFVKYLDDMGQIYPNYLIEFGKRLGRPNIAAAFGSGSNPVERIAKLLIQILKTHERMLGEFKKMLSEWDSKKPVMADLMKEYAPYLKVCKPFLLEKSRLLVDLTELLQQPDFHNATMAFEEKIFHRGPGAVTHQLDQVHQNFLRYKNLMISYKSHLPPNCDEQKKATETINALEQIAQDVNKDMKIPSMEELMKLFDRFQGHFDVFKQGCRLIRQGDVLKQARKEPQPRILLLFSDVLWICRESSTGGVFDMDRSYDIPIDTVKTEIIDHDDFKTRLWIKSTKKSFQVLLKNVSERDQWEGDIRQAVNRRREAVDRIYKARRRVSTANGESDDRDNDLQFPTSTLTDAPLNGLLTTTLRDSDVQAAWIPDDSSTRCLMQGCGTKFDFFSRRHHCRDCGWLICSRCTGHAPLAKQQFKSENVCPECYDRIFHQYERGTLFPEGILIRSANNPDIVNGIALNGKEVSMETLFCPPDNRRLKRLDISSRIQEKDGIVFGRVFQRAANGKETIKYAQLKDGLELSFFAAIYDEKPESNFIIHGYSLEEHESEDGNGALFELNHRNQIRSERREHTIKFRVDRDETRKKWSKALSCALTEKKND